MQAGWIGQMAGVGRRERDAAEQRKKGQAKQRGDAERGSWIHGGSPGCADS
jgi:hypothetical protein